MTDFDTMAPPLKAALAARGYDRLTPVQSAMLGAEAQSADLLVSAQTGSGKTVAFGIAIAPTLLAGSPRFAPAGLPLALIVAPTRELAIQVRREFEWLYRETGARIGSCVGGMDMRTERRALADGAHIVVGTPGRLRDHITRGSLDISELRAVVLDEADEMLDLGFRDDLEFILAAAPDERRTLMFSATVPNQIAQLAKRFQRDALRITATGESSQHSDIEYQQILVAPADRENAIINTLLFFDSQNTIVFCHTREAVKHLASRLGNRGFPVVALSGELSQAERTNALQSMRDGRARVCVATDVAARGIDLPNLDLVIHADMPTNPDTLLHRSGRTGRAGRKGICTLIVPYHRRNAAARVLKLAKLTARTVPAPTASDIERHNKERILEDPALSVTPAEDEIAFVRELMNAHSPEHIAAAYLRLQLAARPAPEELLDAPSSFAERGQREPRPESAPRDRSDFTNGVWFRVSVGRKHRAEPRWLLPMICKAGHITKRAVGSIKILDTESQFEIAGDKAESFWAAVRENGTGEKGVTIQRLDGKAPTKTEPSSEAAPSSWNSAKKGKFKPKSKSRPEASAGTPPPKKAKKKRPKS
ncbi:DEAD/DEAH box helicase [Allomesorhizobium camelthorni]|uniref:DEAD/DEAH box helicase n=1 Tax=Allomesorhizobium camelthorni TaxID=475069 RepID=A0A6G4WJ51_9HYPH|nr:DEAD/DEAH box helicase [Mesorhizobium camelthorni]NGO54388.1 DEAD/DEAH box helicase [Mesorhizobium camelthorni]